MPAPLHVGVAACFFHADPTRPVFKGKTLLYMEESLSHWLMAGGAVPHLLPTPAGPIDAGDLIAGVEGLVLQGGSDLSPRSYGEEPIRPEWAGDQVRDLYETELIRAAMEQDRPILGICRGLQMLNVALGGTLHQDVATQCPGAQVHRDWERYDRVQHDLAFEPGSRLAGLYGGRPGGRVNSVHHQAVKTLGRGLCVEARSVPDGVIEAVRYQPGTPDDDAPFVYAVQWHPEFQDRRDASLLATAPLREMFFQELASRRHRKTAAPGHGGPGAR